MFARSLALLTLLVAAAQAQQTPSLWTPGWMNPPATEPDWTTGRGIGVGGVLFPNAHVQSVYGGSSGSAESLAAGHHDPRQDGWTLQGIEFSLSGRYTPHLQSFATMHIGYDRQTNDWNVEDEEWFLKGLNLPGGIEVRGGKFLNRVGQQNALHLHGWDWADQYLVMGRMLGDDGLTTLGGEVNWTVPVRWTSLLTASFGRLPTREDEDHGHGEEEGAEPMFESEGTEFRNQVFTANWTNQFNYNDFHQFRAGVSTVIGDNAFALRTHLYGVHAEYQWRENGFDMGGRYFRWRTEALLRQVNAVSGHLPGEGEEEHGEPVRHARLREMGLYTDLRYGFNTNVEAGLRVDYVGGIPEAGLAKRLRVSPGVSFFLNPWRTAVLRVQYNYDHHNGGREDHGVWAQIGFNWGGAEVR